MSRSRREGRISGWAGTLSPRESGGVPRVLCPPLGDRDGDGPVGSEYSTGVHIRSRGSCHIWGTWLNAAEADGEFSRRSGRFVNRLYRGGDGFRVSGGTGSAGGVRLQEGWIPASAGKTDGGGVGGERDVLAELGRLSLDPSTRLPPRRMFHPRQGERPRARRWIPGLGGYRLGGGVRLQEGWIPASAGKTDGGGWGGGGENWGRGQERFSFSISSSMRATSM